MLAIIVGVVLATIAGHMLTHAIDKLPMSTKKRLAIGFLTEVLSAVVIELVVHILM